MHGTPSVGWLDVWPDGLKISNVLDFYFAETIVEAHLFSYPCVQLWVCLSCHFSILGVPFAAWRRSLDGKYGLLGDYHDNCQYHARSMGFTRACDGLFCLGHQGGSWELWYTSRRADLTHRYFGTRGDGAVGLNRWTWFHHCTYELDFL